MEAHGIAFVTLDTILGLSKSHCRAVPRKYLHARTSERRREAALRSITVLGRRSRVGQDHDEDPELPRGALDAQLADVAPVDLGLLADERLDAQEDLVAGRQAHELDVPSQRAHAALVPRPTSMSYRRVARSQGYCASVSETKAS